MTKQAIIFPGQGSQSPGMGLDVAEASQAAADIFRKADDVLGFALSKLCFEGPAEALEATDVQQPAIYVTSAAIWAALQEKGITIQDFSAAAGLSLGEYTALYAAGAMSFEDGLKLVRKRGELMQQAAEASQSSMVSLIGATEESATELCNKASEGEILVPANFNCPGQVVISGAKTACERSLKVAEEMGLRAIALKVAGAFHSPFMAPAADGLQSALNETTISTPAIPVIANVNAEPHTEPESIRTLLAEQLTKSVLWQKSMENLIADGVERFVEVGAGRVLKGLMRKIDRKKETITIGTAGDLDTDLK